MSNFAQTLLNRYLSRKLVKSYIIFFTGTGLCIGGKLTGTEWLIMSGLTFAIYTYGNLNESKTTQNTAI